MTKGQRIAIQLAGIGWIGIHVWLWSSDQDRIVVEDTGTRLMALAWFVLVSVPLAVGLLRGARFAAGVGVWVCGWSAIVLEWVLPGPALWMFALWAMLLWSRSGGSRARRPAPLPTGLRCFAMSTHVWPLLGFGAVVDKISLSRPAPVMSTVIVTVALGVAAYRMRRGLEFPRSWAVGIAAVLAFFQAITFGFGSIAVLTDVARTGLWGVGEGLGSLLLAGVCAWVLRDTLRFDKRMQTSYQ